MRDGRPQSGNFLVRSRDLFAAEGFNVAIVGRPSDVADMDTGFRAGAAHMQDLGLVDRRSADAHERAVVAGGHQPRHGVGRGGGDRDRAATAGRCGADVEHHRVQAARCGADAALGRSAAAGAGAAPREGRLSVVRAHEVSWIVSDLTQAPVKKLLWASGGEARAVIRARPFTGMATSEWKRRPCSGSRHGCASPRRDAHACWTQPGPLGRRDVPRALRSMMMWPAIAAARTHDPATRTPFFVAHGRRAAVARGLGRLARTCAYWRAGRSGCTSSRPL